MDVLKEKKQRWCDDNGGFCNEEKWFSVLTRDRGKHVVQPTRVVLRK